MSSEVYEKMKKKASNPSATRNALVLLVLTVVFALPGLFAVGQENSSGSSRGTRGGFVPEMLSKKMVAESSLRMSSASSLAYDAGMVQDGNAVDSAEEASMSEEVLMTKEGDTMGRSISQSLEEAMKDKPDLANIPRMLVHEGRITLLTKEGKVEETATRIEDMIIRDGGYIASKNAYRNGYGQRQSLEMDIQLRVPSDKFHDTIKSLKSLVGPDMVRDLNINSRDVTESYIDASSRAETLSASRKAMQVLLEKANNVKEVMQVQQELNRLTQECESQKSRANSLKNHANLSTLNVRLSENRKQDPDEEPEWSIFKTLNKAIADALIIYSMWLDIAVYGLIMLIAIGVPIVICGGILSTIPAVRSFAEGGQA
jgi:hypothetical protein